MRRYFYLYIAAVLLSGLISCEDQKEGTGKVTFYETQLFKDVHRAGIFQDSKSFADLTPVKDPLVLNQEYKALREREDFDLAEFVHENFRDTWVPSPLEASDTTMSMYRHIDNLWSDLSRPADKPEQFSSRIPLPYPYIVPGGRFREIYYWDSYFTLEGLLVSGENELAENMVKNFAFLLDSIGFIPNGTRSYYKTRSQPPFFSHMVTSVSRGDQKFVNEYLPYIELEYEYWMERAEDADQPEDLRTVLWDSTLVNRYWDVSDQPRYESYREDVELAANLPDGEKAVLYNHLRTAANSGWDFSSRWFSGEGLASTVTADIIPVDLNCLLYYMERTLADAYEEQGVEGLDKFLFYQERAEQRKRFVRERLWSSDQGFFFDLNYRTGELSKAYTLAGLFPLYTGLATAAQAESSKDVVMERFLKPGGVVTTLVNSGEQWDAPNGWAPLQWITVKGLLRYGYEAEAIEIMQRWLRLNNKVFKATGKMNEKYNVQDLELVTGGGEYPNQDGFGWTNGVAAGFRQILTELGAEVPGWSEVSVYAE